jgi:hypothetical protein
MLARLLSKDPAQRPANASELALALRALALIEETDAAPLPQLELAPEPAPAVKLPVRRRWPAMAVAAAAAVIAVVLLLRGRPQTLPGPIVAEASPGLLPPISTRPATAAQTPAAQTPVAERPAAAVAEPPVVAIQPAQMPVAAATGPAGRDEPAQDPAQARPAASRYAKTFERAQKALWTNRPASAIAILRPLLTLPLTRRDRARAQHMMGDAAAKQGNKAVAARWYSRSLQLSQR